MIFLNVLIVVSANTNVVTLEAEDLGIGVAAQWGSCEGGGHDQSKDDEL